jgi:hypothetical protein
MAFARVVAYLVAVFLLGIGLVLLVRPTLATGPRGLPLLKGESRAMMAVLAAREMVLGLIGLACTGNSRGLLLCFSFALLITVIDAVALFRTRSYLGFVVNNLVGFALLISVFKLWRDLGGF